MKPGMLLSCDSEGSAWLVRLGGWIGGLKTGFFYLICDLITSWDLHY